MIRVPVGTVLRDAETGSVLRDLTHEGEEVLVARGGRRGLGNATVAARAKSQAMRRRPSAAGRGSRPPTRSVQKRASDAEATPGEAGERRRIALELKLIADVGIIGCPNAGKSSLLRRISTAHPKVGAYPFTTRYPVLGVVRVEGHETFVACDIPGLVEGAHKGRGLGIQFLRHIERTRVLVHLVDMAGVDGQDPVETFRSVNQELAAYSAALPTKPQVIVANKMDLPQARVNLAVFERAVSPGAHRASGQRVWPISCVTG